MHSKRVGPVLRGQNRRRSSSLAVLNLSLQLMAFALAVTAIERARAVSPASEPEKPSQEVIFISQVHRNPLAPNAFFEQVASSQFEVLKAIRQYSGATVFMEGATFDRAQYDALILLQANGNLDVRKLFPQLPHRYLNLSNEQRKALFEFGAVEIALALGWISKIKATDSVRQIEGDLAWLIAALNGDFASKEKQTRHIREVLDSSEYKSRLHSRREKEALSRILDHFRSQPMRREPVLLVFGAAHDFERHSTEGVRIRTYFPSASCASSFR